MRKKSSTTNGPNSPAEGAAHAALFEKVLTQYSGMLARMALAYEADPALRRDLLQDIMMAIWSSLPRLRHASSLKAFVAGIAYNQSMAHVTRAVRRPKFSPLSQDLISQDPLPEEIAALNQRKVKMLAAVQSLPLAQKQAIILFLEDFTFEEIGQTLGISARAAAMRCRRAKTALIKATEDRS